MRMIFLYSYFDSEIDVVGDFDVSSYCNNKDMMSMISLVNRNVGLILHALTVVLSQEHSQLDCRKSVFFGNSQV